ncbi:MAG: HEAT repeat domain-containing protein [Leptolyngbyaceae cyanobacterium SL_7_1]|nr:HEAT repeat domain-containing protein [Leptolyngbyaceae cyanobacterium SL_7_1]
MVRQRLWEYDWHETLTLMAGLMKQPIGLIEVIAAEKDDIFGTQLLLAGRCVAECGEVEGELVDGIVDWVYQFWLAAPWLEFIQNVVVAIGQSTDKVIDALIAALNDEARYVRESAAEALGKIGSSTCLEKLLQSADRNLICRSDVFLVARSLAIRFSKAGLPFIPVYLEVVGRKDEG